MILHENYLEVKSFLDALDDTQRLSAETVSRYWFYARHLLIWADEHPLAEVHKIPFAGNRSGRLLHRWGFCPGQGAHLGLPLVETHSVRCPLDPEDETMAPRAVFLDRQSVELASSL
jgi:hypothetical protein